MKKRNGKKQKLKPLSKKKKRLVLIIAAGSLLVTAACYTVFLRRFWIGNNGSIKKRLWSAEP